MRRIVCFVPGIPTARNVDHTGFVVPDLGSATTFFVDVLGATFVYESEWIELSAGRTRIAMLRVGPVTNVELIQNDPESGAAPARGALGSPHLAFYVDDIERAVAYLTERNVEVALPIQRPNGPVLGESFVYFVAPWGTWMELRTHANGLAYEKLTSARTYPAASWGVGNSAVVA